MTEPKARCEVLVDRGDHRWTKREACGRPMERDGKCKMHLRVAENHAKKDAAMREGWERGRALSVEASALGAALGTRVVAHYDSIGRGHDGRFVVEGDWLRGQVAGEPA